MLSQNCTKNIKINKNYLFPMNFRKTLSFLAKKAFSDYNYDCYGNELASQVAEVLERKKMLTLQEHQCYCGVGFAFYKNKYHFCRVWDGIPMENILSFESKIKFVEWLGSKNDFNMSGSDPDDKELYEKDDFYRGNQRIYKQNLHDFLLK